MRTSGGKFDIGEYSVDSCAGEIMCSRDDHCAGESTRESAAGKNVDLLTSSSSLSDKDVEDGAGEELRYISEAGGGEGQQ